MKNIESIIRPLRRAHELAPFSRSVLTAKSLNVYFQNTKELEKNKTEEPDQKSLSSVSVPGAGQFYEPFLRDLELIWRLDSLITD